MFTTVTSLLVVLGILMYMLTVAKRENFMQNYYNVSVPGLSFLQMTRENSRDYKESFQPLRGAFNDQDKPYLEGSLDASPAKFKNQKTDLSKHFLVKVPSKRKYKVKTRANFDDDVMWEYPTSKEAVVNGGQFMKGVTGVNLSSL